MSHALRKEITGDALYLEFMVEEPSMQIVLNNILPKIIGQNFEVHAFNGKMDLIKKLPDRLKGRKKCISNDRVIIVVIDRDEEDCIGLKRKMESIALSVGLSTRTNPGHDGRYQVVNRIAIEELEAWFFGDIKAIRTAFPKIPENMGRKVAFRDPDAIAGGTWEALERQLKKCGYYSSGIPKNEVARLISTHMDPDTNRSRSFRIFIGSVKALVH
jgi:hypothetical protein